MVAKSGKSEAIYSGGKNKPAKPCFPYKTDLFKRVFRDKNVDELLYPSKDQSTYTRRA